MRLTKCPKCGEEIDYLAYFQSGEMYSWFSDNASADRKVLYEEQEFQPDNQVNDYDCPECGEVISTSEDKAKKFLKFK